MANPITPSLQSVLSSLLQGANSYEISYSQPDASTHGMLTLTVFSPTKRATYHWYLPDLSETERSDFCALLESMIGYMSTTSATMSVVGQLDVPASRRGKSKPEKRAKSTGSVCNQSEMF